MPPIAADELVILRHAPADHGGRLCGRTDVSAIVPDAGAMAPLRELVGHLRVVSSPALRCHQTAKAVAPGQDATEDARLWEQDFGTDDGRAFSDLPDLGPLPLDALARHAAPGGESFADMCARVTPALQELAQSVARQGPVLVVAHAGTARAALGVALGAELGQPGLGLGLGLSFEVAPLSMTRLRCLASGISIIATNQQVLT